MTVDREQQALLERLKARFEDWNVPDDSGYTSPQTVESKPIDITCQYCGSKAHKVTGDVIYPHVTYLHKRVYYLCTPCDAYVGCHPNGVPFGELANSQLRTIRVLAHNAFDPLWKEGKFTRTEAYAWLAEQLGMTTNDCHIGKFDVEMCRKVAQVCNRYRRNVD